MNIIKIAPSKVRTTKIKNVRLHEPDAKYRAALGASIDVHGDDSLPAVRLDPNDKVYDLVFGFGRHDKRMSSKETRDVEIEYILVDPAKSVKALQLAENNARAELHWVDNMIAIGELRNENPKDTQKVLAAKVGLDEGTISSFLMIAKSPYAKWLAARRKNGDQLQSLRTTEVMVRATKDKALERADFDKFCLDGTMPAPKGEGDGEGSGNGDGKRVAAAISIRSAVHADQMLRAYRKIKAADRDASDKACIALLRYLLKETDKAPIEYELPTSRAKATAAN